MWPWNRNLKDGYIGVTRQNPKARWNQHKNGDLGPKFDEHGLGFEDMNILEEDMSGAEARAFEEKHRPKSNMGWNKRPSGGGIVDDKPGYCGYHIPNPGRTERFVKWLFRMGRK